MATPTVYVICDQNCKFEGMTKEQILTAIAQAVETGEIKDVDAGFVQTIKTINGKALKFFVGEQSAYDALTDEEKKNLFAIITNETKREDILEAIKTLQTDVKELKEKLFQTPELSTTKRLEKAGFYMIALYSFIEGVPTIYYCCSIYWDGVSMLFSHYSKDHYIIIDEEGIINVKMIDDEGIIQDITDFISIYISKMWG